MSPTILHELLRVKRQLTTQHNTIGVVYSPSLLMLHEAGIKTGQHYDPVKVYKGLRPYEIWCEEQEREEQARLRAGGRTICSKCDQRSVVHRDVYTLGFAGHLGAEISDYGLCENCGYGEL